MKNSWGKTWGQVINENYDNDDDDDDDDDDGDDDDDDDNGDDDDGDDGDGDKDDGSGDGDGEREDGLTLLVRVSMRPLVLRADVVLKQTLLILLVRLEWFIFFKTWCGNTQCGPCELGGSPSSFLWIIILMVFVC